MSKYTNIKKITICLLLLTSLYSCNTYQKYRVASVKGNNILVDSAANHNQQLANLINRYKSILDKEMNVVIGYSEIDMQLGRPESLLTNFTSDAMIKFNNGIFDGYSIDLAIVNVNGHRAPIAKGNILIKDMFRTYSFDNALVILKIKGKDLLDLFDAFAQMGGAGISNTAKLIIKDKKLVTAKIKGENVDPDKAYTIITLDYLAEGNDGMKALKEAENTLITGVTLRDYMIGYVQKKGTITSHLDKRIEIQ